MPPAAVVQGFSPTALASVVPQYHDIATNKPGNRPVPTVLEQCVAEQRYVRESMTRTLLYAQVRLSTSCCSSCCVQWVTTLLQNHSAVWTWNEQNAAFCCCCCCCCRPWP